MTNPYTPPRADLGGSVAPHRPAGVWVVSLFYGILAPLSVATFALLALGRLRTQSQEWHRVLDGGWGSWLRFTASAVLVMAFSIALFRLRRIAVQLAGIMIAVAIVHRSFDWIDHGLPAGPWPWRLMSWICLLLAFFYARRLRARGVLR